MSAQIIKGIKDVAEVCQEVGLKCKIIKLDEVHDRGYTGIKLILGYKINPAYDPNATLDKPESNPKAPDIRIIWMQPGITFQELSEKILMIKKSLETKAPIIDRSISTLKPAGKTDAELAAEVVSGLFHNDFGDDDDIDEIDAFEDSEAIRMKMENSNPYFPEEDRKEHKDDFKEIMEALATVNENLTVLSGDVQAVDSKIAEVDKRLKKVEKPLNKESKKESKKEEEK